MLAQRVITAVVLLALLVPALAATAAWPFLVLTLVLIAAAGWEWGRLNGLPMAASLACGAALTLGCGLAWSAGWTVNAPVAIWWLATAVWVLGGALALRAGPSAWPLLPQAARLLLGLGALWAAWLALACARGVGLGFILSVLCVVWVADIAAYFGGRALGRRKLAPSISPGKSWEGVFSGMLGVAVLAIAWLAWQGADVGRGPSLFSLLRDHLGIVLALLALAALTGMSVVGDLIESLAKRAAGAKDSSRLLPGHGGVLDRVDALLPTLPMALALTRWGST
jgi:phosphatidate cytidylyltransferase